MSKYDPRQDAIIPVPAQSENATRFKYKVNYNDDEKRLCITVFRRLPWLKDNIDQILVEPIQLSTKYYDSNNYEEIRGARFYYVKLPYYKMRCSGVVDNISDDDVVTANYGDEIVMFRVAFKSKDVYVIQNRDMYKSEREYLDQIKNSNINVPELRNSAVTTELRNLAILSLEDYTPSKEYTDRMVKSIENSSSNAYEFSYKINKVLNAAKYGNIFSKRLYKGFYNEDVIGMFDYDVLLEGSDYDLTKVKEYVEDSAINMLVYTSKFYDIPTRKYAHQTDMKPLKLNKLDIRVRCDNIDEVKNTPEENLAFYTVDDKLFCYDITELYYNFKAGNNINPHSGQNFDQDFINRIIEIYNFKVSSKPYLSHDSSQSEDYDDIVNRIDNLRIREDPMFVQVLQKVRLEIDKLKLEDDKCIRCNKNVLRTGINTLDAEGRIIKHCSKECFEKK